MKLVVKLSNPTQKDHRHGPQHEGREVYIKNLDWRTTDDELETLFETYGKVERVRIIRGRDGNSKGFAYVVFSTKVRYQIVHHEFIADKVT